MTSPGTKALILAFIREGIENRRAEFACPGNGGRYTQAQKEFALKLARQDGMRAAARILDLPRRTLQRWRREQGVYIPRCPCWVYEWAARRRKRREFWRRKGYG
jgi:hypothetical protein